MADSYLAKHGPTITSHRTSPLPQTAPERFWIPLRLSPPTVAPGQTPGALRFVSLAPHILPQKGERHRRNVSARKVSEPALHPETYFSTAPLQALHNYARILQHTASLDVLAEPNYYSKLLQTSSTRVFASHLHEDEMVRKLTAGRVIFKGELVVKCREVLRCAQDFCCGLTPARRLNLLIPPPASTLQFFQFIPR